MKQKDFFSFLNQLPDALIILDAEQKLIYVSNMLEELLGYKYDSLVGCSLLSLLSDVNSTSLVDFESGSNCDLMLKTSHDSSILFHIKSSKSSLEGEAVDILSLRRSKFIDLKQVDLQQIAISNWEIGTYEHNHVTGEIYASKRVRELYGFKENETLSFDSFSKKFDDLENDSMHKNVQQAYDPAGDGLFEMTHRINDIHGNLRWLHSRSKTTFGDVEGKRIAIFTVGSVMDITSRKELEIALFHNEELLTQATKVSQVGVFEHDHSKEFSEDGSVYWSPTFREIVAYDEDKIPDPDWFNSRVHPDDLNKAIQAVNDSHDSSTDGNYDVEHRWLHPDGDIHWFLLRGKTTFTEIEGKKKPVLSVGGIIDVTSRHKIEEDIQRRSRILEATPDFVCITDLKGNFIYLNQAGRNLLGFGVEEDVTSHNMMSVYTEASLQLVKKNAIETAITSGSWKEETEFKGPENTTIPMSQVLLTHMDTDNKVAYISIIARDLTKEKKLEEQFNQAQKMDAIGRLAGGIAHDFNNMLSIIMGFTSLAVDKLDADNDAQNELQEVLKASEKAAALTKHLLAFSRKQILQPQVVNIHQLLGNMESMIKRLVDESIQVNIIPSKIKHCIKADPIQLEQIILNLVSNARDAMVNGGQLIIEAQRVELEDSQSISRLELLPGSYVQISVSDTGHGMDAKTKEKVFEPFFTTKDLGQGTGLGLATVFGIVKQSKGGIWIYSEPGKGTAIKLYFPCSNEEEISIEAEPHSEIIRQGNSEVVLVAEDNDQLRSMVTTTLKNSGYRVLSARNGPEAISLQEQHKGNIDLLLTDVVMPKMSGKELADAVLLKRPDINVLYMSGYTEGSIVHQGVLDEDVNFLPKPVTPQKLLLAIANLF